MSTFVGILASLTAPGWLWEIEVTEASIANQLTDRAFVPLDPERGISAREMALRIGNRELMIWGAGALGRNLLRRIKPWLLEDSHITWIDQAFDRIGPIFCGFPLINPASAFSKLREHGCFLLLAIPPNSNLKRELNAAGLRAGLDFDWHTALRKPEAYFELVGPGGEQTALEKFRECFRRVTLEEPELHQVELCASPNRCLTEYANLSHAIQISRQKAWTCVTSHPASLNWSHQSTQLALNALGAQPHQWVISINQLEFQSNLDDPDAERVVEDHLRAIRDERNLVTPDTEVRVRWNGGKGGGVSPPLELVKLCARLELSLVGSWFYPEYDALLEELEAGGSGSHWAKQVAWPFDQAMQTAQSHSASPCLCQRIFPVVNHDGSLRVCHLYRESLQAEGWWTNSRQHWHEMRGINTLCRRCQAYSLHQLDWDVLQRRSKPNYDTFGCEVAPHA
jgi:hypothetical protein